MAHRSTLRLLALIAACAAVLACSKRDRNTASPTPTASATPAVAAVSPTPEPFDACALLTPEEIANIQGSGLVDAKRSQQVERGLLTAQCYFALPRAADSIALSITRRASGENERTAKEVWDRMFHEENKKPGEEEEERKAAPPLKIDGLGDEAFWVPLRFGGTLFVLKGDAMVRIGLGGGGGDDPNKKAEQAKALAAAVVARL